MEYKLIIDQKIVDEYNAHYFRLHPRARKPPIEKPIHPSINEWMIMKRPQMNQLKQKHKDFIVWFINKLGYANLMLDKVTMTVNIYKANNIRMDCDNATGKFWNDGFTEAKFWVDDDFKHVKSITTTINVDKEWPRTEIIINTIEG